MIKFIASVTIAISSFSANALTLSEYLVGQAIEVAIGKKVELHTDIGPFDNKQQGVFSYGWKEFERNGVKYMQLSNVKPEVAKTFNKELLGNDTIKSYVPPVTGVPYAGYATDSKYFIIVPHAFLAKVLQPETPQKNSKSNKKNYLTEI
jgi:hypothetical protein